MFDEGEYGEGFMALKLAIPWLHNFKIDIEKDLPLLNLLDNIISKSARPYEELKTFVLKSGI